MIVSKLLEIRDRATLIPVIATLCRSIYAETREESEVERWLLSRAGYGTRNDSDCVLVARLMGGEAHCDCYDWVGCGRTMPIAHDYIQKHWLELESGDVIDVEYILGESTTKKLSERITHL